jgi:hypothetical protein
MHKKWRLQHSYDARPGFAGTLLTMMQAIGTNQVRQAELMRGAC